LAEPLILSTPDPRFDPADPVVVNGYVYIPSYKMLAHMQLLKEQLGDTLAKIEAARGAA
jgi:hypothetical protein